MSRAVLAAVLTIVGFSQLSGRAAEGGDPGQFMGYHAYPLPIAHGPVKHPLGSPAVAHDPMRMGHGGARLDAAMYPVPRAGIPASVGGTMNTNPALDPHEMLYAHTYRTLYPPYYYKVNVDGIRLPLIGGPVWHRVELKGTQVKVKYRSQYAPFSMFFPPR